MLLVKESVLNLKEKQPLIIVFSTFKLAETTINL